MIIDDYCCLLMIIDDYGDYGDYFCRIIGDSSTDYRWWS